MITSAIIEGLTILEKYQDKLHGYNCGADHDVIYRYETDRPVQANDLERLVELGWYQHEVDFGPGDFEAKHYDPEEGWSCNV